MNGDLILVAAIVLACGGACGLLAHIIGLICERRRDSRKEAGQGGPSVSMMAQSGGEAYEAKIKRLERLAGRGKRGAA
jgi:hypothetical protein